jgi:EF hand domain-containing protein
MNWRETMKTTVLTILATLGLATASLASTAVDTNGDGMLTIEEVQAAFPEVGADTFSAMDVNADGALDSAEVAAAQEAGLMPVTDG